MNQNKAIQLAAAVMILGVGLGAFGAHGFEEILEKNDRVDIWNTAVKYHLIHGVALFALALSPRWKGAVLWMWTGGILLFSGSLYALALSNIGKLGAITPLGGVLFLTGWGWILFRAGSGRS